ncbi:MAG: response regulator [Dehalococcoidia bacterium]|nr:response regulator [Dehalococcoidia bacterium]
MTHDNGMKPVDILLVEDNPGDVRLTQEALKDAKLKVNLHVVNDGVEAMAFLHGEGQYASKPPVDLVLLDLNLPRKDGRQVLAEIKGDPDLRRTPVVVVTTSKAEEDIVKTYDLHANCYVTKPLDLDQFITMVQSIEHFWFSIVKLPTEGRLLVR